MDVSLFITDNFKTHYKKLIVVCTAAATIYFAKKYMDRKKKISNKRDKKKIKEFPTVDQIQKFIEELPFDEVVTDNQNVSLKDLLGELSEFSEDEDWKDLIASVHYMYQDDKENVTNKQESEEIKRNAIGDSSILYEDRNDIIYEISGSAKITEIFDKGATDGIESDMNQSINNEDLIINEKLDLIDSLGTSPRSTELVGNGDASSCRKEDVHNFEEYRSDLGQGDKSSSVYL